MPPSDHHSNHDRTEDFTPLRGGGQSLWRESTYSTREVSVAPSTQKRGKTHRKQSTGLLGTARTLTVDPTLPPGVSGSCTLLAVTTIRGCPTLPASSGCVSRSEKSCDKNKKDKN